jgi:quinol monooxygenase YgiN
MGDTATTCRTEERTVVILHATAAIKPEARDSWFALLAAVTPPSRAEDACQSYIVYEAIETPNTFIFVEEWASLDDLYAHFHTPHFTQFFAGLGELLAAPPAGSISEVSSTQTLDESLAGAGIG